MASKHGEFLAAGARLYGMSADTPAMNAAVAEKLALPFPILSDPDRSEAITPLGFADEPDPRKIALPGTVIIAPGGEVVFSVTGRDYADRPHEDDLLAQVKELGLNATSQPVPAEGSPQAGDKAVPFDGLTRYFSGAKFAVLALRRRHRGGERRFRRRHEALCADGGALFGGFDPSRRPTRIISQRCPRHRSSSS